MSSKVQKIKDILIVEDSPTQAEILKYTLEQHHFRTFTAANGREAIALARELHPSIIVSDIIMPEMDGYELCKKLKSESDLKAIPIILLTALSDPQDILRGLESGADNFITKPYDEKYLLSQIDSTIENVRAARPERDLTPVSLSAAGQNFTITSDRRQILNVLLSTYEAAILKNRELEKTQDDLKKLNEELEDRVRRRTFQVLNERHRLYNVLETLPIMVCLLTPDYHVAFSNRSFREKFGESQGRRCYEYCFGKEEPCEFCESYEVLKTGRPHHWEVASAGIVIDAYDFPFTDEDGSTMILEMDIDITARKQAETALQELNETLEQRVADRTAELEAVNKELESFSYSVSHDLKAPLRSMNGFSSIILEDYADKLDDKGKEFLNYIQSSSQLMGKLIDDILTLSRISRAQLNRGTVDLSELASGVERELRAQQPERRIEFKIAPGLTAEGDRDLLKLVFDNLLGNACKFTASCAEPVVEFGMNNKDGKSVYFIRDNGAGFDMTYVDKLFKPFQRLHTQEEFPGTGVGLASVQRIINRHGGRVWAEGKKNNGATFYFTLG